VKDISGLYAASAATPYLSLLARTQHFRREQLDDELYVRRTLGRIRCMRKAIYILPSDLLAAAHWATRSLTVEASRRYLEHRGVPRTVYEQMLRQILDLLRGRELTAIDIRHALRTSLDVRRRSAHVRSGAAIREPGQRQDDPAVLRPVLRLFPESAAGADGRARATMRRAAVSALVWAATEADIAGWMAWPGEHIALQHMRGEVVQIQITNRVGGYLMLRTEAEACQQEPTPPLPVVNLLPSHDPACWGYRDRDRYVEARYADRAFDQTGNVTSTILLNGRMIGVWDLIAEACQVRLFLFKTVENEVRTAIETAARQIGCFVCRDSVAVQWCTAMPPLARQPLGSVMSPLRNC
jgi:hypothetical protein